jgi:hypothetical protein
MKTTDIFAINRKSSRLNETIAKTFGRKINFENFDLPQLEDARNKLRTQVHTVRQSSGFNENLENDAFHEAQWMLDAINSEIAQRENVVEFEEPMDAQDNANPFDNSGHSDPDPNEYDQEGDMAKDDLTTAEDAAEELRAILDSDENLPEWVQAKITKAVDYLDTARDYMKAQDHEETQEQFGESMTKLREGEIQQASAIVTAKTMVDRVSRWIEELSGMENDTLLQLGDSIRDEMGQDQAKRFISSVAPAIQQALENLKSTREALSSGVRALTGEEQGAEMLGGDGDMGDMGADEFGGPAAPDEMNSAPDLGDDFSAAEPSIGGAETAGREKRESVERQNRLMKVLAG